MAITRDQSRDLDRRAIDEFGVPAIVLMENAGRAMAELLLALGIQGSVAICCGKGNNGGDGLVIARHLDKAGIPVRVLLFARVDELTQDAAINWHIVEQSRIDRSILPDDTFHDARLHDELASAHWVVDALFGSGLSGPVRPPFDRVITAINASHAQVLAVDIPSGLDCDTGRPMGATVRADHTAAVMATRVGFELPASRVWVGRVHVIDIGAPRVLVT